MPDATDPAIVDALTRHYGKPEPPAWGLDPFEAIVATLLEPSHDASKRPRALEALRDAGLLDPQPLAESDVAEIAEALRSAGVKVTEKALVPLRRLAQWLVDRHDGDADSLAGQDAAPSTEALRAQLTAIKGIGPTLADTLLLLAFRRPVHPVDRPTYRVMSRHGWIDPSSDYDESRDAVERLARDDPRGLARFSAWFDRLGRDFCRATVAKCDACPLKPFLPEGGPIDPNA
ncbi:MAG: endonuclease III [Isosphaeraceae bacterium]